MFGQQTLSEVASCDVWCEMMETMMVAISLEREHFKWTTLQLALIFNVLNY